MLQKKWNILLYNGVCPVSGHAACAISWIPTYNNKLSGWSSPPFSESTLSNEVHKEKSDNEWFFNEPAYARFFSLDIV